MKIEKIYSEPYNNSTIQKNKKSFYKNDLTEKAVDFTSNLQDDATRQEFSFNRDEQEEREENIKKTEELEAKEENRPNKIFFKNEDNLSQDEEKSEQKLNIIA